MAPRTPTGNAKREAVPARNAASGVNDTILRCLVPRRIFGALLLGICFLVVAGIASNVLQFTFGYRSTLSFIKLFALDQEGNIPTWFSSLLLFSSAILLGLITTAMTASRDRWRWHWGALAFIFVMLSLDEIASIHERTNVPIRNALDLSGAFYFAWVVPAAILVLVFAILYLRFVLALPRRSRWLFVVAGAIFVSGALGVEMIGSVYASAHGRNDLVYALIASGEEVLEMIGLATFIYALTDYIRSKFNNLILRFNT